MNWMLVAATAYGALIGLAWSADSAYGMMLCFLGVAIGVGVLAQQVYQRTGVVYAVLTLLLQFGFVWFIQAATRSDIRFALDPVYRNNSIVGEQVMIVLFSIALVFIMWGVLHTLPRRNAETVLKTSAD